MILESTNLRRLRCSIASRFSFPIHVQLGLKQLAGWMLMVKSTHSETIPSGKSGVLASTTTCMGHGRSRYQETVHTVMWAAHKGDWIPRFFGQGVSLRRVSLRSRGSQSSCWADSEPTVLLLGLGKRSLMSERA